MPYKIKLEQFEGPLDLLLQLIEQEELDITEVSLANVTDQYLQYLNTVPDIHPQELADFLVVAAKLLLIKSRHMLPQLDLDEEDDGSDLEQQLRIYREFHEASKVLQKMIGKKKFLYPRERMAIRVDKVFNPPTGLTTEKLHKLFIGILKELEPWINLPREVMIKTISIRERIQNIQVLIQKQATISFQELLKGSKNKTEIIVTFLALLELVKQRSVAVVQSGVFDDISVTRAEDASTDQSDDFIKSN